jgi:D-serine deaminase-like pyridoxal phosphate-dependent protein
VRRRALLLGGAAVAAGATATLLWRPGDRGAPHDAYFAKLNALLKRDGPGHPIMLIDLDRVNRNIDLLAGSVGSERTYRVVEKSLPCVDLLEHVMTRAKTRALMTFHRPFLNIVSERFLDADVLLGKPMPVAAARTFYEKLTPGAFDPATHVQWLVDTHERLLQYQQLARELGIAMRVNLEIDVGLHRGGFPGPDALDPALATIADDDRLTLSGVMGYEPHLTGVDGGLEHPAVQAVLGRYRGFVARVRERANGVAVDSLTLNGAGSHTLRIYERDRTMNDLSAGSGVVKPSDFDTRHLEAAEPAVFIATPILKRHDGLELPGDPWMARMLEAWDPNRRRLYFIYGGYWKATFASPSGVPEALYHSTNQEPVTTSTSVDLAVDDYMFLRPTQSEHVMLQFGDLHVVQDGELAATWPVFHERT